MTKLLVSVQDAAEAHVALAAGADVIDVKDPNRGSLGAARASVVDEVLQCVSGRLPVSIACGELVEWKRTSLRRAPLPVQFAKLGLSACAGLADWPRRWAAALNEFPSSTAAVAVVYADGARASAPSPAAILCEATRLGCRAVLVDTYDKAGGALLDHWSIDNLKSFLQAAAAAGLEAAVAGSLESCSLARVLRLAPDYVAVRGAVCRPNRTGRLDGSLVAQLVRQLQDDRRAMA